MIIMIIIVIAMFIILSIHVDLVEHDEVWIVGRGDRLRGTITVCVLGDCLLGSSSLL